MKIKFAFKSSCVKIADGCGNLVCMARLSKDLRLFKNNLNGKF
jgi:hypothetical protein